MEGAVAVAVTLARQAQLGRVELHSAEMDHAVGATFQPRLDARQTAHEAGEKAVVEATYPGLSGADDPGALAVRTRDDLQLRLDVDDSEALDKVTCHPARQDDFETAGDEIDEQTDLCLQLCAGELKPLASDELGRDRQNAGQPRIGEDRARNVSGARDGTRRKPQRHAHWPRRETAASIRADVDETGVVEFHGRRGEAV